MSRATGNERPAVNSTSFPRMYSDMEAQIHHLEQEAYCAVLRAFKAQSDALTWVMCYLFSVSKYARLLNNILLFAISQV